MGLYIIFGGPVTAAFRPMISSRARVASRLTMRCIPRGGSKNLLVLGVPSYNTEGAGDDLHALLSEVKPATVLMESFTGECFAGVDKLTPGAAVPYRDTLAAAGLQKATELVASPDFRQRWTSEAVAVLAALAVGADIRLCDRSHAVSFERLIAHRTLDQLRHDLIEATEAVAVAVEQAPTEVGPQQYAHNMMPQNAVCRKFKPARGWYCHSAASHRVPHAKEGHLSC